MLLVAVDVGNIKGRWEEIQFNGYEEEKPPVGVDRGR